MAPFKKNCCNPLHKSWNSRSRKTRDLKKIGGLQVYLTAFANVSKNLKKKSGSVFCLDCLAKCPSKRSFTQHLSEDVCFPKVKISLK